MLTLSLYNVNTTRTVQRDNLGRRVIRDKACCDFDCFVMYISVPRFGIKLCKVVAAQPGLVAENQAASLITVHFIARQAKL